MSLRQREEVSRDAEHGEKGKRPAYYSLLRSNLASDRDLNYMSVRQTPLGADSDAVQDDRGCGEMHRRYVNL